jgi:hypothetical protein
MSIFFSVFMNHREISSVVAMSFPLLIERSTSDRERIAILQLARLCPENLPVCECAASIVDSFPADSQRLVEVALDLLGQTPLGKSMLDHSRLSRLTYRLLTETSANLVKLKALSLLKGSHVFDEIEIRNAIKRSEFDAIDDRTFRVVLESYCTDEVIDFRNQKFCEKIRRNGKEKRESRGKARDFCGGLIGVDGYLQRDMWEPIYDARVLLRENYEMVLSYFEGEDLVE